MPEITFGQKRAMVSAMQGRMHALLARLDRLKDTLAQDPALSGEQQNERVIRAWDEACAQYIMVEKAAAELTVVIAGAQKGKSSGSAAPCSSQLAQSDTTAAVVSREQRGAPRFVTQDTVGVQPLNPLSSESVQASLENVSRGGMRLRTAIMLGTGTLIKLHLRSAIMFGEVRYCESSGNKFFIGIQFSDAL
jgi:hypothetical protein